MLQSVHVRDGWVTGVGRAGIGLVGSHPPPAQQRRAAPDEELVALVGCSWPLMALGVREAGSRAGIACTVLDDADQLVLRVEEQQPDLCLLLTPFTSCLPAVITRVSRASLRTRVVVLSADEADPSEVLEALQAGADGWLPLDTGSARLVHTLRAVALGEAAVPRRLLSRVLVEMRGGPTRVLHAPPGRLGDLSRRELDVLCSLARGLTTGQVAVRLGIGEATVRGYVASAVRRLQVPDRAAAVALVASAGQVPAAHAGSSGDAPPQRQPRQRSA